VPFHRRIRVLVQLLGQPIAGGVAEQASAIDSRPTPPNLRRCSQALPARGCLAMTGWPLWTGPGRICGASAPGGGSRAARAGKARTHDATIRRDPRVSLLTLALEGANVTGVAPEKGLGCYSP